MKKSTAPAHTIVAAKEVFMTTDYGFFKIMEANRNIDPQHVKTVQRLMLKNGNLTGEFPIIVDKEGYVIDGQHRLEALKGLGWEVGYRVEENATIETVRSINQGGRNWTWRDVADSYAKQGNTNYKWFLTFIDQYGLNFTPALTIVLNADGSSNVNRAKFFEGDMVIENKAAAYDYAGYIVQASRIAGITNNDFFKAMVKIVASPHYNHERMIQKLRELGDQLPEKAATSVYQRDLEDIFNNRLADDKKVRLF